jgi:hypothetical protein
MRGQRRWQLGPADHHQSGDPAGQHSWQSSLHEFHPFPQQARSMGRIGDNAGDLEYFKTFLLRVNYTADTYVKLLGTFSPNLALPANRRKAFLKETHDLITSEFANQIAKPYGMSLTIGRKI